MSIKELVQSQFGPASQPQSVDPSRDFGWFATPGRDGEMIWVVGLSDDHREAKTIAKRKRVELQEALTRAGLGCTSTPVAYSDDQGGRWIVGRSLLVSARA